MNHKLIVVFDSFNDEDHARWFGQYLLTEFGLYARKVYVVQGESED